MNPALEPLAALVDLNTALFRNCLAGVDDDQALARPSKGTNNIAFIAAHLVDARAWMARYIGLDEPKPYGGSLDYGSSIDELARLPTLAETMAAWSGVSERLRARLQQLGGSDLAAPSSQRFPAVPETVLGGLAFLVQHESYHVGQLALLRKYVGLPAMSYRLDG
jgi:uncharacterized damage-inducible protein DinB